MKKGPGPGRPSRGNPRGQTPSYLLLPVLGQQQADLRQLLLDDLLVDHVQLQTGLWVFGKRLLGVVLVIAGFVPPFFFLVKGGDCRSGKGAHKCFPVLRALVVRQPPSPHAGCRTSETPDMEFQSGPAPSQKTQEFNV